MRWSIILLSLFLISIASATPTLNFQHEETQISETILATITATEFADQIEKSDITFYEGRKKIFLESDITFYDGTHYLYIYATREGNFSIEIANILYRESGQLKSTTLTKEFEIKTTTPEQILSIKPGFFFTNSPPKITLTNKGTSSLNLTYNETDFSLQPEETKEITYYPSKNFSYLDISSYKEFSIPIIYIGEITQPQNETQNETENNTQDEIKEKSNLTYSPSSISLEFFINNETTTTVQLSNNGTEDIKNIEVKTDISFIKIESSKDIPSQESNNLTLSFFSEAPGYFQGQLNITYTQDGNQSQISIPLNIFVLAPGDTINKTEEPLQSCKDIGAIVCPEETPSCNVSIRYANGEPCCPKGSCYLFSLSDSDEPGSGWIIGLLILAVLGFGGYYLYLYQKKMTPKKPEDKLKEVTEKYKKRMSGDSSNRIKGGLSKS